ncbi:MAG TPA: shikimate dehydrogenase [Candidatus Atribacteria bacterium]|nr:MAG: Shikimate dehydrogenase [Atribacteria bacterium 34_128]HAJ33356.1 shikimate dehydrogenase [Candidatus Atribacteria bacterium]
MKKEINGKTKTIGLIGENIENSLSPFIHNQIIIKYSLDFCYLPFQVKEADLNKAIQGIKALNIKGVNVTFPYKEKVIEFLDEVKESARRIGAVNTIVNNKGNLTGYNTDLIGFKKSLQDNGKFVIKEKNAVILGAGGAARGVIYTLLEEGIEEISIFNRTLKKAKKIKQDFSPFFPQSNINIFSFEQDNIKNKIKEANLLVNATSIGMVCQIDNTPLSDEKLFHPNLLVYDLIYHPVKTLFLKQAERAGAKIINGLPMLVYQGIESFYLWTGLKPDGEEILEIVRQIA